MDRNDIITLPHESLRQKSTKVSEFDDKVTELVKKMTEASLDWEESRSHEVCVGLAAVQVNIHKKIVIIREDQEDRENKNFIPLINPKIIKTFGKPEYDFEGCLSIKDIYGKVPRFPKVKVKAQDLNGDEFRITAEGFLARLLQHEVDHTNGVVFIDHIKDEDKFYRINDDGKITKLDHDEVRANSILWD